ncbi:MAG: glycosyltransferase family 4 protein [Anaerolineae bacterium]|nr:glycosyltransferase family 4 protein [Anaerolineae bacterium]
MPKLLVFNLMTDADDPVLGFTTTWINALAKHFDQIDVLTMQAGRLAVAENVRVHSLGKEHGYSEIRRALRFYRILWGLLRQNRYKACFAHMNQLFAFMGAPLLKLYRVPQTLWYAHKSTPRTLWLAEKWVDHVVTSSAEGFRMPSRKLHIIGQGIDTVLFAPVPQPPEGTFTLISTGRLAPVKRLETMIAALDVLVNQQGMDVRLRLVGNAAPEHVGYENQLRQMVNEYGLTNRVEFVGAVAYENLAVEYHQSHAMVNMSLTGSMDKAVLEAMACELPVITANDAYQKILAQWANTLLVPPESPEVLPLRLSQIITMSPDERAALGHTLRQIVVEEHSLERLIRRLLEIL